MNFPRQLKPVAVTISGGDEEDRRYWAQRLNSYLRLQPCVTMRGTNAREEIITISPDANNN